MEQSTDKNQEKKKVYEVITFPVPFPLSEKQENININSPAKTSKEKIINQAIKYHSKGNISQAAKHYKYFINEGFTDHRVFSNYGIILKDLGKTKEAEFSFRKAIELKPDYADAHYNLGNLLKDIGKLEEAEFSFRKAIEIKPDYTKSYYNLGNILRDIGKLQEARLCSEKIMSLRSWSILGSYSFNYEMQLDLSHKA